MREILFRGKRKDNGEWIEGYFVKGKWYLKEEEMYLILPLDLCLYPHCEISEWIEIDPKTVCQYIGLKDKNGKKIYEGDIVGIYSNYRKEWDYGVVKYGEFNCSCCSGVYGWHFDDEDIREYESYEVKGNIFDNPELLKEDTENANTAN